MSNLIHESSWKGLAPGDAVNVSGLRGSYTFQSYVTNPDNGAAWVNIHGGTGHLHKKGPKLKCRSVDPSRVTVPTKPQRRSSKSTGKKDK